MPVELKILNNDILMDRAERQYKFVLIYCRSGCAELYIDEQTYELTAGKFLTITSKQFYQFNKLINTEGFVLEFTYDFFCIDDKSVELLYHNGLYCHFGLNEVINIPNEETLIKIENYFSLIKAEFRNRHFEYKASIHSLVKLLIIEAGRCKMIQQGRPLYTPDALFLKFLNLVRDTFSKRLTIKEYADELNITEARLNELTKKNTGETTKQLIKDLIIMEAKRLFTYENLNVKQVAFELGFNDTHYFSRFFKKQTSTRARDHLRTILQE